MRKRFGFVALGFIAFVAGCGSSEGDSDSSGGSAGQDGGTAGSGGTGGSAGTGGVAGTGGGTSGTGGDAGEAGTGGVGGAAGNAGTAGSGAAAGMAGSSGSAGMAGTGAAAGAAGTAGSGGCGQPGEPCCGTSCDDSDYTCDNGTCVHCGLQGEPCCGDQCEDTSNVCDGGVCVHCGAKDEPCCGFSCDSFLSCVGTTCQCGDIGQTCCNGTDCDGDFTCDSGVCACPSTCSADQTQVIDCHGQALQTCTGNEECVGGVCLDPCVDAAAQKSSYGCDFWALKTDLITAGRGACFAAFVTNTWDTPVHISVSYDGQTLQTENFARIPVGQGASLTYDPYDAAAGLPPGEVAILFLSRGDGPLPACPVPAAVTDTAVYGTGRGKAFHITTDKPVGAYQILPYGGGSVAATSATLLLPVNVWDTTYMAVNAYQKSAVVAEAQPSLDILARVDGTQVTVTPKVAITGGNGVAGSAANQPVTYSLNAGEYVQITQNQELTGSLVVSSEPVAFWGAASCLSVPVNATACDSAHQQIPPINALGNAYVGVRYRGRAGGQDEAPPWRLVGAVDGTVLTWQPSAPAGAPTSLSAGQVAEFAATGPFVVSSQDLDHPFYAAAYMTGGANFGGEGDPEWVNIIPPDQYLDNYVLFTDPTYSETNLVVVRKPDQNGQFADVTLDCAGTLSGWQPIGDYQYTRVDLVTGNFQNVGSCSNGRHEMSSTLPFGVTVWGWGSSATSVFTQYVSYAYPAGASVKKINDLGN